MVVRSVALAFGRPFVLRRRFSARGFWPDVRRHRVTAFYYIGEICRYLLAAPPGQEDRDHTLRVMTGAGLRADVWREFVARFGVRDVYENLGATESNYGITNADNIPGSVGRLPYPEQSNIRVLKYDLAAGCHVRGADGAPVWAQSGEVGELVAEALEGNGVAGFFEGYTSEAATEAKVIRDLVRPGDRWVKSGDLVRFDEEDYLYFVDRVGDTFRWKSENVSTEEVALALAGFAGPLMVNVYGVAVPGEEGKAGMVALTYADPAAFDGQAFYAFARATLPPYAVPVFVRVGCRVAMTTTFKLRKVELQRDGFDPALVGDDVLFVADAAAGRYVALRTHDLATPVMTTHQPAGAKIAQMVTRS
jgi:fatty-acyl-CoA synthase